MSDNPEKKHRRYTGRYQSHPERGATAADLCESEWSRASREWASGQSGRKWAMEEITAYFEGRDPKLGIELVRHLKSSEEEAQRQIRDLEPPP